MFLTPQTIMFEPALTDNSEDECIQYTAWTIDYSQQSVANLT